MFNMIFSSLTFVFLFGTIKANGGSSVQDLPLAVVAGLAGGFFIADLLGFLNKSIKKHSLFRPCFFIAPCFLL